MQNTQIYITWEGNTVRFNESKQKYKPQTPAIYSTSESTSAQLKYLKKTEKSKTTQTSAQ